MTQVCIHLHDVAHLPLQLLVPSLAVECNSAFPLHVPAAKVPGHQRHPAKLPFQVMTTNSIKSDRSCGNEARFIKRLMVLWRGGARLGALADD